MQKGSRKLYRRVFGKSKKNIELGIASGSAVCRNLDCGITFFYFVALEGERGGSERSGRSGREGEQDGKRMSMRVRAMGMS